MCVCFLPVCFFLQQVGLSPLRCYWAMRMGQRRKSQRWGEQAIHHPQKIPAATPTDTAMPRLPSWFSSPWHLHLPLVKSKLQYPFHVPVKSAWLHPSCGSCHRRSSASSWSALGSSGAWCCCISPFSNEPAMRTVRCCGSRSWTLASATSRHWQRRTKVSWMGLTWEPWRLTVSSGFCVHVNDCTCSLVGKKTNTLPQSPMQIICKKQSKKDDKSICLFCKILLQRFPAELFLCYQYRKRNFHLVG